MEPSFHSASECTLRSRPTHVHQSPIETSMHYRDRVLFLSCFGLSISICPCCLHFIPILLANFNILSTRLSSSPTFGDCPHLLPFQFLKRGCLLLLPPMSLLVGCFSLLNMEVDAPLPQSSLAHLTINM